VLIVVVGSVNVSLVVSSSAKTTPKNPQAIAKEIIRNIFSFFYNNYLLLLKKIIPNNYN